MIKEEDLFRVMDYFKSLDEDYYKPLQRLCESIGFEYNDIQKVILIIPEKYKSIIPNTRYIKSSPYVDNFMITEIKEINFEVKL